MKPNRYLLTMLWGLGDVLCTTPAMRALLTAEPEAEIIFRTFVKGRRPLEYDHPRGKGAGGAPERWPSVVALVPARDEADVIERTLGSLLEQDYPGPFRIVLVDDESADGTGVAGSMLEPKPTNLRVMSGNHPDGDFAFKIREGRGAMPSWKGQFDDTSIWHLVNFIQALKEESSQDMKKEHGHADGHKHDADS